MEYNAGAQGWRSYTRPRQSQRQAPRDFASEFRTC